MKSIIAALGLCLCMIFSAQAQTIQPFKQGDRVVFVGNSITDGGRYHAYIWLYYMTHYPNRRITCFNGGIGGDVIGQIADRFDYDVLSKKPTVVTLTWGMNDSGYFEWFRKDAQDFMGKQLAATYATYAKLEDRLKSMPKIRTILIGGSPYDETTKVAPKYYFPGKNKQLAKIVEHQQQSAQNNHWGFVDFYHPMDAINKREQMRDTAFSLTPNDRIHPENNGHLVMAYLFLKSQGLANNVVADVAVNAADKRIEKAVNSSISNVALANNGISFNYLAKSLPYPVDTLPRGWGSHIPQSDALKLVPFMKEFNQELLTVKNLKDGEYDLLIDGERMKSFTANQLSSGINLAEIPTTPQYQQAIQIRELNEERWDIERRIRMYVWVEYDFLKDKKLLHNDSNAALDSVKKYSAKNIFLNGNKDTYTRARYASLRDAWQQEMNVLINKIYAINKPVVHKIELMPVK